MSSSLHILVCQYYLREVQALLSEPHFTGVSVAAFPDVCVHPQAERLRMVERLFGEAATEGRTVVLVGACFMLQAAEGGFPKDRLHKVYRSDLCFHLLVNRSLVESLLARGAYIVTPGWLELWDRHLAEWGFDRATARAFFAETSRALVLLDTGVSPSAGAQLKACAEYLDLPYETVAVGLDHLRMVLTTVVQDWRLDELRREVTAVTGHAHRRLADYMLALDLLVKLSRIMREDEAIRMIQELFAMLFGAGNVLYAAVVDEQVKAIYETHPGSPEAGRMRAWMTQLGPQDEYAMTPEGFCLRIRYKQDTVGLVCLNAMAFREHERDYLNLALGVVNLCGLAIANARIISRKDQVEAELARSNGELEQFAYVVSHDLQAPLRRIMGFGELLEEDAGPTLNEAGRSHMARIRASAVRMQQLIEGLLTYARVSTRGRPLVPVQLQSAVRQAVDDLAPRLQESRGRVDVGPLPGVRGDELQLYQLFLNLIGNGLKFVVPGRPPVVRISAVQAGDRVEVTVQDNGIGFEDKDVTRLFKPFQRLHSDAEYPGSGIGLAVCQKIALRHGGEIRAHGDPGQGATFTVTLPSAGPGPAQA